jgi:NADPH:quinone reductase-like Zn-dependent oxidoreductase
VRAALLQEYGAPPVLGERADPTVPPGHALVATGAAPVVPLDLLCASGSSYFGRQPLPYVPGVQGVGRVLSSAAVPAGSLVWFPTTAGMRPGDGSLAELAVAADHDLVVLPDGADELRVAALGTSAIAAWMALTWRGSMAAGEQVLVLGAGGAVGQVAVQAARRLGARRVVAACRSDEAQTRASRNGADAVVPLVDGEDADELAGRLAAACDGPVDVVVDPLFGVPATAAARLLGSGGRLVNLGSAAGETAVLGSAHLRSRSAAVLGYTNNDLASDQRRDALLAVLDLGVDVARRVVPLDEVATAWADQASGRATERIVLQVGRRH